MKMAKPISRMMPSIMLRKLSNANRMRSTEAPTEKGMSFFTVEGLMIMGATIAAQPTMSIAFIVFDPTTLPTAISGVPFNAETRLTNNSGADVPAATMVSPMMISGTFILRANDEAPSVSLSAPNKTSATPTTINRISNIIVIAIKIEVKVITPHSGAYKIVQCTTVFLRWTTRTTLAIDKAADAVHL